MSNIVHFRSHPRRARTIELMLQSYYFPTIFPTVAHEKIFALLYCDHPQRADFLGLNEGIYKSEAILRDRFAGVYEILKASDHPEAQEALRVAVEMEAEVARFHAEQAEARTKRAEAKARRAEKARLSTPP